MPGISQLKMAIMHSPPGVERLVGGCRIPQNGLVGGCRIPQNVQPKTQKKSRVSILIQDLARSGD